jgi:transcription antitermination factor NusG
MQKNWYIIYAKPKTEKKVAAALSKRKIENFIPLNSRTVTVFRKKKIQQQPLFQSYLFVYIHESEIPRIRTIDGVINLVYWKNKPATVSKDEIHVIKEFVANYTDIKTEKISVNTNEPAMAVDHSKSSRFGNILVIKNTIAKVKLPSIGFSIVAQIASQNSLRAGISFGEKEMVLQ